MYNLLIALVIAGAMFAIGAIATGTMLAGIIPAILAFGISYVLLGRRTMKKVQAILEKAASILKQIRADDSPTVRKQKLDECIRTMESARKYRHWQFLVDNIVSSQLGALYYIQKDYMKARPLLQKAWLRDWTAHTMLAILEFRDGNIEAAKKRMEKATGPGKKDAVMWGVYAYILSESGRREEALAIVARGLKELPSSEALKALQESLSNDRKIRTKLFAPMWYTFFPEDVPIQKIAGLVRGKTYPQPRR